jgi:succinate-semialdehyde dehydrogenase/glutarate-semialdehyde dehydrogenase
VNDTPTMLTARNPRTGVEDYRFAVASRATVGAACEAVRTAQPAWQALGLDGRSAAMRALSGALQKNAGELAAALAADTGRTRIPQIEAAGVQGMIAHNLRFATDVLAPQPDKPSAIPGISGRRQLLPYKVVGVIAPWNFPLILSMIDTIPALIAGCGVVLKPSEVTPRYVDPLQKILASVPEVAAVLRIVRGPGSTGADLIDHVDAVVCTGSVRTGRIVAEHAARRFIPAFLELGGKDAVIVCSSADPDRAAQIVLRAAVQATGQACQSLERVYVHESLHDRFMAALLARARTITLTCDDPQGHIGPFIMGKQADIVKAHIDDAIARGARCELGGRLVERGGRWCEVTVLSGVTNDMQIMRAETFGPVIPVARYHDTEEAIALANDSDFGLSANVISADSTEANRIAERLNGGFVSINDCSLSSMVHEFEWEPCNLSGLGRARTGPSGIARYLRVKTIATQSGEPADMQNLRDA